MSVLYGWVITHDSIDGGASAGILGPRGVRFTREEMERRGEPFRMLDDDGVLYYEGFYLGPDDETAFKPLDDYGLPNAGCTTIQYRGEDGAWAAL